MNLLQYARVWQNGEKASLLFIKSENSGRMKYKEMEKPHTGTGHELIEKSSGAMCWMMPSVSAHHTNAVKSRLMKALSSFKTDRFVADIKYLTPDHCILT